MIGLLYFGVILITCILAAIVGLGGGVFFRPIFDAIGYHDFNNIQFLSSCAIIVMAVVSTIKKVKDGTKIDMRLAASVSFGSILGGLVGDWVLEYLQVVMSSEQNVQLIQTISTIIVLSVAIFLTLRKSFRYETTNKFVPPLIGFALGLTAVYLGIGGGPLNVPLFMIFLGMATKDATAYSIVVIFFTHAARLVRLGITTDFFTGFDLGILPVVAVAAAIGGLLGAKFSKLLSDATVKKMFIGSLIVVIMLNMFNGIQWINS